MEHVTGMALADALVAAGLAPEGISKLPATRFTEAWYYVKGSPSPWRPWESWDAVAHLIERYTLQIGHVQGQEWAIVPTYAQHALWMPSGRLAELPCLIGNMALALRAREVEQEQDKRSDASVLL